MIDYTYGWEKLNMAVHSLAGTGSQKERLQEAIAFSLSHIKPENDLPPEMRAEFEQFIEEMNSVSAQGDEGTIQATVQGLGEGDVGVAIERVISFYDKICRYMPR